ncbi:MAG: hypothetical protein JST93_25650 [Acidobacteria bacterium]|nr:hypothetical protein [Acidobacteriota bacterium]
MKNKWMAILVVAGGSVLFAQQYPTYNGDYDYDGDDQGVYAPAPPPMPRYAYQRPPMPGPGYVWSDGYWSFYAGRYSWVGGYWMLPPYAGAYWVAPRYTSGRFFRGYWGRPLPGPARGYVRNDYHYQRHVQPYRSGPNRDPRPRAWDYRGGRR